MKCISLWQPWATLMAIGAKRNETRSWPTTHRGPLAIHAAKRKIDGDTWGAILDSGEPWIRALQPIDPILTGESLNNILPFGCVLCVVNITDCVKITSENAPLDDERAFGDYFPGRFMWQSDNVIRLPKPVPFRGAQGFFDVPDSLIFPTN